MQPASVGNYDIIKPLGSGGTARVFLAKDRDLKRVVALKLLHPHLSMDQDYLVRFRREAVTSANLDHPNIINVFAFEHDDGNHFMTIEYIDGAPLNEFLQQHQLKYPQIGLMIAYVIADAIGYAHQQQVIHRDIKPENIMISSDGTLKVTDFGIAKIVTEKTLTMTGSLLGSPAYMSPEQALGKPVQQQSDIFSLGTLIYFLITGQLPFYGNNPTLILKRVIETRYEVPSRFNPLIDRPIEHLLQQILVRDPKKRLQSLEVLKQHLGDILKGEGIEHPRKELTRFFKDPGAYQQQLQQRLVDIYREIARKSYRKHQILKALRYCNKALILAPDDQKMQALLRRLNLINSGNRIWYIILYGIIITLFLMFTFRESIKDHTPLALHDQNQIQKLLFQRSIWGDQMIQNAQNETVYLAQILHGEPDHASQPVERTGLPEVKKEKKPEKSPKKMRGRRRSPGKRAVRKRKKRDEHIPITIHKKKRPEPERKVIALKPLKKEIKGRLTYCFRPYATVILDGVKQKDDCITQPLLLKKGGHRLVAKYRGKRWERTFTINEQDQAPKLRYNFLRHCSISFAIKSRSIPKITLKDRSGTPVRALIEGEKRVIMEQIPAGKFPRYLISPGVYYLDLTDGDITHQNRRIVFKKGSYRVSMDLNHDQKITVRRTY